jgi:hypothetical protein
MQMTITVRGKVWRYSGFAGWHFFTIGKKVSTRIKKLSLSPRRGFGSVRVTAQIGKTEWKTSIFPTKEGTYLLAIKSVVRKKEQIELGDAVRVRLTIVIL